jgi:predicted anti-sigma-YlaC factor YlaD
MMNCKTIKSLLPDLLLDPAAVPVSAREHLKGCSECREELTSLQATMSMLDEWAVPEPSPYFNTRMQARLRTAKEEAPEGFWERMRDRILFSTNVPMRAVGAAALAVMIMIGGGSAIYETQHANQPVQVQASATVNDLQSLDGNAQVFQQLNALDADDSDTGNSSN